MGNYQTDFSDSVRPIGGRMRTNTKRVPRSRSACLISEVDKSDNLNAYITGSAIKGSQVLPGLYVGNFRDSKDQDQLRSNNITHIVSIHDHARKVHDDKEYLCIQASDSPRQNLTQFFSSSNDFIHSARSTGGNVLIHCLAGVSRSVTIAVAYIMSITNLTWREALKAVRGARSIANPNVGFQNQLSDFESSRRLNEERRRLRLRFPNTTCSSTCSNNDEDEAECRKLLLAYHNYVRPTEPCASICRRPATLPQTNTTSSSSPRRSGPPTPSSPRRRLPPGSPRRYPRPRDSSRC